MFLWLFFFTFLQQVFFPLFCNLVMKPPGHWQPACSDCNPSVRTLTSCASAIYCNIHCTTVAWQVWSGCDDGSGDLATRSKKSNPLLSCLNLPLLTTSSWSRTVRKDMCIFSQPHSYLFWEIRKLSLVWIVKCILAPLTPSSVHKSWNSRGWTFFFPSRGATVRPVFSDEKD